MNNIGISIQIVLAGSFDNCVYVYSVDYGRALAKVSLPDMFTSLLCVMYAFAVLFMELLNS
jgi:hypothetical protein